jgi:hypothetical protein
VIIMPPLEPLPNHTESDTIDVEAADVPPGDDVA